MIPALIGALACFVVVGIVFRTYEQLDRTFWLITYTLGGVVLCLIAFVKPIPS